MLQRCVADLAPTASHHPHWFMSANRPARLSNQEEEATDLQPLDVLLLRIGSCLTDPPGAPSHLEAGVDTTDANSRQGSTPPGTLESGKGTPVPGDQRSFPEGSIAVIAVSDLVEWMRRAVTAPHCAGVRVRNATATHSFLRPGVSVPALFRRASWLQVPLRPVWGGAPPASLDHPRASGLPSLEDNCRLAVASAGCPEDEGVPTFDHQALVRKRRGQRGLLPLRALRP